MSHRQAAPARKPLAACLAIAFAIGHAQAGAPPRQPSSTTRFVTTCDDSGTGSLRDAVLAAANGDTIDLSGLACSTITLTTGAIDVDVDNLILSAQQSTQSAGPNVTIDGGGSGRVFDHAGTGWLQLSYLALRNGVVNGNGGCIRSNGNVQLAHSSVTSCRANQYYLQGKGGGVYAAHGFDADFSRLDSNTADGAYAIGGGAFAGGDVRISTSTISGNAVVDGGLAGGLYARGTFRMYSSTVSDNHAGDVGGLFLAGSGATLGLAACTITGNEGDRTGGILAFQQALRVYGSTIAFNQARIHGNGAGGIAVNADGVLVSSIVADNTAANDPSDIGRSGGGTGTPVINGSTSLVMASSLQVPPDTIALDPMLSTLTDHGGPTLTLALQSGSPAIDHGAAVGKYDQRGAPYQRTVGANADIGAFEFGAGPDRIFLDGFDPITASHPACTAVFACAPGPA